MFEKTHGYVRIFLGVSIPFFSFLVNDVQSRKKRVFLQSWCVFNLLSVFEETLWRKQMSFLYLSCSEYSFLYFFWSLAFKTEKVFFYNLGVSLPYFYSLKKHYRQNKQHFCIFLGVSIPFFIFWVNGVQSRKKVFFYNLGVSLPYF